MLFGLLVFMSCEESSSPSSATVYANVEGKQLTIVNATDAEVYYSIYETSILPLINWAPICGDSNKIIPNSSKLIVFSDTTFLMSNQAVVYWWFKGPKYNSVEFYGADSIRSIVVSIK